MEGRRQRLFLLFGSSLILLILSGFKLSSSVYQCSEEHSEGLRLATANLHFENRLGDRVAEQVTQLGPDLLVVFECTKDNLNIDSLLAGGGLSLVADGRSEGPEGVCVLSSPGLNLEVKLMPSPIMGPCEMPFATMRLSVGNDWISLLALHAPPPMSHCRGTNRETLVEVASWIRDGRLVNSVGAGREQDPVILLGDLNALPFSRALWQIRRAGLIDAYSNSSIRPGATWAPRAWLPPLARIDYILVPGGSVVGNGRVTKLSGSDHRMVSVDLHLDG